MSERMFPVLLSYQESRDLRTCPREVPWSLLAPHEQQAKDNHDQDLEKLASRGGLGISEMVAVIDGIRLRDLRGTEAEYLPRLLELLAAFLSPKAEPLG